MRPSPLLLEATNAQPSLLRAQHASRRSAPKEKLPNKPMRNPRIPGLAFGLLFAATTRAFGCELCAIYSASQGLGAVEQGWFTGVAEQFTTFGSIQFNGREVANPAKQYLESSTTQFLLGYSFNEHFSLQANIPYIHRAFQRPNGTGNEVGSQSGLGDAILLGKLLLLRRDTADSAFAWSLLGGVKFPTGDTSQLRDESQALNSLVRSGGSTHGSTHGSTAHGVTTASSIHGFDLALGSGSFDARIGTSFHYRRKRAYFGAAMQYAINSEGDYGYRFANDLSWDGGTGYFLFSEPSYTFSLEAAISGEHRGADTYKDQPVDSSGFTVVYVGPKVNYTWKDRLTAHLGVDFPVSVTNSGLQAVPGPRVRAGLTWMFGPGIVPADSKQTKPRSVAMDGNAPPIWTPAPDSRFYGGVDYLLWWVKDAPLSVPLVTTGAVSSTHHGFLSNSKGTSSDTTILYGAPFGVAQGGNGSQRFQGFSGSRVTFGYALGSERRFAVEASGFVLQQQSAGYAAYADLTGNPIINIPVFNTVSYTPGGRPGGLPPAEDGLPASLPSDPKRLDGNSGIFTGGVKVTNSLQLWGAEATGVISLHRGSSWEVSGLVGARYLDLSEAFNLTYESVGISGLYNGSIGAARDAFETRNEFSGGMLGLRGRYASGRLSVDLSGRVAVGVNHQTENVAGGFWATRLNSRSSAGREGVFAQPANEGRTSMNSFAVVPDAQIKIGYALTPRLRATLGYDFLYLSSVLRPGDQISHYVPKGQTFQQGGTNTSTTSPARYSETTDFFAHGFSLGLEFRF